MSPFEIEIREEATTYFKKQAKNRNVSLLEAIKATPLRKLQMTFLFILALISVPFFVQGYWPCVVLTPILIWIAAANTTHDALHFSVSTNWRINSLLGYTGPFTSSPFMWYHQHVIGHHAYPNVEFRDPDLAHAPGLMRVHESVRWKPAHNFQLIWTVIIWTIGATFYMTLLPLRTLYKGMFNQAVVVKQMTWFRFVRHLSGRVLCAVTLWAWPWFVFSFPKAVVWCVVPMAIHSICFMACTQLNHLTQQNATSSSKEYYVHQVVTSHSFSPYSKWIFWLTGGLNLQIEHHLFPTVNHCHLPALHFMVKTVCAKHNVPYHQSDSFMDALGKYFDHLNIMSKPTSPPKEHIK